MTDKDLKNVALGLVIALSIFSLIFEHSAFTLIAVALLVGIILELKAVSIVAFWWHKVFSAAITLISNVILSVLYILVFTPYAYVYRAFNKNNVKIFLKGTTDTSSYHPRHKTFAAADLERPW